MTNQPTKPRKQTHQFQHGKAEENRCADLICMLKGLMVTEGFSEKYKI